MKDFGGWISVKYYITLWIYFLFQNSQKFTPCCKPRAFLPFLQDWLLVCNEKLNHDNSEVNHSTSNSYLDYAIYIYILTTFSLMFVLTNLSAICHDKVNHFYMYSYANEYSENYNKNTNRLSQIKMKYDTLNGLSPMGVHQWTLPKLYILPSIDDM